MNDRADDIHSSTFHSGELSTPVSAVILTKNEEAVIERCVQSVSWADEVLVIDSGSTDRTIEVARAAGARVHVQSWLGYSAQRNKGAELAAHDWIFFVDADEVCTRELAHSISSALSTSPDPRSGFAVNRRGEFCGLLLSQLQRRSKWKNFVRLYNRTFSQYDPNQLIHEEVRVPGPVFMLRGDLLHWRHTTLTEHFAKYNSNSVLEAEELRRAHVAPSAFKLVVRPVLRFGWVFFCLRGYRHGVAGLVLAMLHATGEFFRYAKLWEAEYVVHSANPPGSVATTSASPPDSVARAVDHPANRAGLSTRT